MKSILLGLDRADGAAVRIPKKAFETHFHLIGGTGKGKTTAIHTILHQLLLDPFEESSWFVFDRLGNFSYELLLWLASDFCTEDVRRRLVYVEPGREDVVLGFNPLLYDTDAHGYYKVERATEIVLRAWESQNIDAMPRLARWVFNAFWAAAQLGLTISDCVHFLMPGSPYHRQLLDCLPERLRYEWSELIGSRSGEVIKILDSSRNRLKPYFESAILRRMFGSTRSRLDVERFMREGKIVLFNLAPQNRLSSQLANTIGALVLNEVLAVARSLPRHVRYPTYLLLDEFQNFVGPDIEAALPEVRQLGLRMLLAHQSLSQLERGDFDLTSMIFQAQSRMIFGVQGEDADLLAHELASITYDPMRVKDELYTRRQRIKGNRIIELTSWSDATAASDQWSRNYGEKKSQSDGTSRRGYDEPETKSSGTDRGTTEGKSDGGSRSTTQTRGGHESVIADHEDFVELSSRTYYSFEEGKNEWARELRNQQTGDAILRLVNEPKLRSVRVKRSAPGYLGWEPGLLQRELPEVFEDVERMIEENFRSDIFVSPHVIERETEARLQAVLRPPLTITGNPRASADQAEEPSADADPFS